MAKEETRYQQVYDYLRTQMEEGQLLADSLIPSENELCRLFSVTRTTVRTALGKLEQDGYIERSRGKPARVRKRRQSLGLLTVKGFSEAAGGSVETRIIEELVESEWPSDLPFQPSADERSQQPLSFSRIRLIEGIPVMWEKNWFAGGRLKGIGERDFHSGSFFRTLDEAYGIRILGSEQELHALPADAKLARQLQVKKGQPLLQIYLHFSTSRSDFSIFSRLLCNTNTYKIGNTYSI